MSIIVFVEGAKVTGYEVANAPHIEAARLGLFGDDAVTYERAEKQLGADVLAALLKNMNLPTREEALSALATKRGKAFIIVDRLPTVKVKRPDGREVDDVDFDALTVDGGKVVLKAAS